MYACMFRESNDATLTRLLPGSMSVDQATAAAGGSAASSPVATPAETPSHSRTGSVIEDGTVLKPTKTHQKVVGLVLTELLTKKKCTFNHTHCIRCIMH